MLSEWFFAPLIAIYFACILAAIWAVWYVGFDMIRIIANG